MHFDGAGLTQNTSTLIMSILMFIVAFLYASVGHGGASGYLAVLSFFGFSHAEMASTALMLNILVAGLSFYAYFKGGHFSWRLTWPFIITSIPMAYMGGLVKLPPHAYSLLLAFTLLFAAYRLAMAPKAQQQSSPLASATKQVPLKISLPIGAAIGLLSGMVGVGGGIFLSPLILLMGWGDVKPTSATSALFIVVNAVAGLLGRFSRHGIVVGNLAPLLLVCALGGWLGAYLGANLFSSLSLRRLLALVLLIASVKLFLG
jgi:uncharacterized membrane protein YfcA